MTASRLAVRAVAANVALGFLCPATAQRSLDEAASDRTASLMSFQLQGYYTPNLRNADGSASLLQFLAAIPFEIGGYSNIARLTLCTVTLGPRPARTTPRLSTRQN